VARTALVAGGTGALGTAVVQSLLDDDWRVIATWVVEAERAAAAEQFGDRIELVQLDAQDADAVAAVVRAVSDLKAVVNLIGGYRAGARVHEAAPDDLEQLLGLNLLPSWHLAHAAMPVLTAAGGGSFVAVSAKAALQPSRGGAAYSTSKAAVLALVRALDADNRKDGIRCNAVVPSVIDTPANRQAQPDADHSSWVHPERIGEVVRYLVSDAADVVTGSALQVYGTS
jgi:NAD(P)-dependent dehydrogenase (short-subunit alcohol dehydrogenase family)